MKKQKTGILGGTFNPIHNGHVALAKAVYEYCELEEVWFMPSGTSYMKNEREIVSCEHRLEMVKRAIKEYPYFKASDMEILRGGNTYTVDTLREVHERYPDKKFYFIMGADSLFSLPEWKNPKEIAALCTIAAVCRDDFDNKSLLEQKVVLEQLYGADIVLVPFKKIEISSSIVRERLKRKEAVKDSLAEAVNDYIRRYGLYEEESDIWRS